LVSKPASTEFARWSVDTWATTVYAVCKGGFAHEVRIVKLAYMLLTEDAEKRLPSTFTGATPHDVTSALLLNHDAAGWASLTAKRVRISDQI
jgi:hypothetical protein